MCFLSHNKTDREVARSIGAQNDSLGYRGFGSTSGRSRLAIRFQKPGRGLTRIQCLCTGVVRQCQAVGLGPKNSVAPSYGRSTVSSVKIVPCLLDKTPLPLLLPTSRDRLQRSTRSDRRASWGSHENTYAPPASAHLIQAALQKMDVRWITHPALPPMVCCPRCGETDTLCWQEDHGEATCTRV